ncbi:MAG: bifunctional diaminohydroxyphosphoribosylaminopyrimidine deaminase/5-amino-6-(5-phosphoribosylamino)uracil reductase RibD [Bacteroidetes bacterium]|nr:bifunctional diaminohydroxyphosphoribosylaminopyrimidine deaminase/5-amino-6-(5-phosphoribosylamino)uracil reductase RibD [Bacteroidota bacterium]
MDELMMRICLQLAERGAGYVAPNPLVGAVLVHDNAIIGEGYHRQFGSAHAEVNAINDAIAKGFESLLSQSTLYVNLEPCSHHGKTPPCSDLIIHHKIPRVIIANEDPFPEVNGRGIQKLRTAGIEVVTGVLKKEGRILNRRFFTYHEKKRPYIVLKFAQSADGFIAPENPTPENRKISNPISDRIVHQWRSEEASILIGKNTAQIDNPELTVRLVKGKNPVRVVIDHKNELPASLKIFNEQADTILLNSSVDEVSGKIKRIKFPSTNLIESILSALYNEKILSVLVEGGASILSQFLESGMWDECRVITSSKKLLNGLKAPVVTGNSIEKMNVENDSITIYANNTGNTLWNS